MREQFEITTDKTELTEVRSEGRVSYSLNDGDTILSVSTSYDCYGITVSKYKNSSVRITITIEHDDPEYKNIEP